MKDNILCIFIMLFVSVTFNANAQKSPQGQFSVKGVLVDSMECIYNRLLLNILYVINQKYGLNL